MGFLFTCWFERFVNVFQKDRLVLERKGTLIQVIKLHSYFSTDIFHVIFSYLLLNNIVILEQKHPSESCHVEMYSREETRKTSISTSSSTIEWKIFEQFEFCAKSVFSKEF